MQEKKKKKRKIVLFLILILLGIMLFEFLSIQEKKIVYLGKGAIKVWQKDGYTTTFSTKGKSPKIYKEYKQGNGASWSYMPYWDNQMWDNGCGITTIAILATGYGKQITPEELRKQYYPHLEGNKMPEAIQEIGIDCTAFVYANSYFTKEYMIEWLKKDTPILICVTNKPNARWTKSSHYMLLLATDEKSKVYVSNPNEADRNNKSSGWYDIYQVIPYIAKALFIK